MTAVADSRLVSAEAVAELVDGLQLQDPGIGEPLQEALIWLGPRLQAAGEQPDWPGTNTLDRTLETVGRLDWMAQDTDMLIAALLYHPVHDGALSIRDVLRRFGREIAQQIRMVQRMEPLRILSEPGEMVLGQSEEQVILGTRLLLELAEDFRAIIIKIAERIGALAALRASGQDFGRLMRVEREISGLYSPVALRMGLAQLHWQMEDLAFSCRDPERYQLLEKQLRSSQPERGLFTRRMEEDLSAYLRANAVSAELSSRTKNLFSLWRKMQRKGVSHEQIYDMNALRVVVKTEAECYNALRLVHQLWRPLWHEFNDYINAPKLNGYRSLHTAVSTADGQALEVQIRTVQMHREAEYGVCAHWVYKREESLSGTISRRLEWLQHMVITYRETGVMDSMQKLWSEEGIGQQVYVYTPKGNLVELPQEATVLDFAYRIHLEVGHATRSASMNGRDVSLSTELITGAVVEVYPGTEHRPLHDWLDTNLGFLSTSRSLQAVRAWFGGLEAEQQIVTGHEELQRIFAVLGLRAVDWEQLAQDIGLLQPETLFTAFCQGKVPVTTVFAAADRAREGGMVLLGKVVLAENTNASLLSARILELARSGSCRCSVSVGTQQDTNSIMLSLESVKLSQIYYLLRSVQQWSQVIAVEICI